jgi:hypothetical protein
MEIITQQHVLVNTDSLRPRAPHWLHLDLPDTVPESWFDLICSFLLLVRAAWSSRPPEEATLEAWQFGKKLVISQKISPAFEAENPEAVLALNKIAQQLTELSEICLTDGQPLNGNISENEDGSANDRSLAAESSHQRGLFAESNEATSDGEYERSSCVQTRRSHRRAVAVFSWDRAISAGGGLEHGRDEDSAKRMSRTLNRLRRSGSMRPLYGPVQGWSILLDALSVDFPNFAALIKTVIKPHLALISQGFEHRMARVLLVGPPGIGKTYFVQKLAFILNAGPALFVPMAAETNSSTLAGSSNFWSNSSPGVLFERLAWSSGNHPAGANPLVILDEIDKVKSDRYDPLGPLYSLLEEETARTWQDQSLPDVTVDASHVRVLATANDASVIPEPLVSRVLVFTIAPPDRAQSQRVVQRIFESLISGIGVGIHTALPTDVMESATAMSPREAKVRLSCALAMAFTAGRDRLLPSDWQDANLGTVQKKTIGFNA